MFGLSKNLSYTERMRANMVAMLFGAGIVCTAIAVGVMLVIWLSPEWGPESVSQRLDIISYGLLGALVGMMVVIVSLALGGPVGRISGKIGTAEITASDDEAAKTLEVTATATVSTPAVEPSE